MSVMSLGLIRSISSQQLFKAPNKLDKKMEQGLEPLKSQTSMRQHPFTSIPAVTLLRSSLRQPLSTIEPEIQLHHSSISGHLLRRDRTGQQQLPHPFHLLCQSQLQPPSVIEMRVRHSSAKKSLVYSYGRSFNGFAAKLSEEEVTKFSDMEGVVSVLPNTILKLHTTRSWDFMGFTQNHLGGPHEGDVIVGLLDTGIWPESESFGDKDFGPPPAKWNGRCQTGNNFTCNNKIIGARYYNSMDFYDITDFKSPRDSEGHGTHTASTAAGREVAGVSYFGLAEGIARDILAAFDDAIADGVDIISVSLGSDFPSPYFEDPIAIGSFHAMKNGILTSNSAGNSGPWPLTVSNYSPWSLTVAASTIDRKFVCQVVLGNGQVFTGTAINNFDLNGTSFPLIWGGDAANFSAGANPEASRYCLPGYLNSYKVEGKIVLCDTLWDATLISTEDGIKILEYVRSSYNPIATILVGETWKDIMAPTLSLSHREGLTQSLQIFSSSWMDHEQPDLTAPGVDILAAWSPVSPPSIYWKDTRSVNYNIISGTSMSCPHVSGAAAYIKATNPTWSPAAIKSPLMTTAYVMDSRKHEDAEFAYGSGHINPLKAVTPGLVFDASEADYIDFLCKQGYNTSTLRLVTGDIAFVPALSLEEHGISTTPHSH
ncbi:hypothetical protein HHK36_027836 [Tetracentron sinense]|uniref:Subtilisin n=1 Tax=Tetracentron sinense TaxID=13715 RepID=A0A835D3X2_TETSI|nr:hypothetical protein HHK36_027836 [Tetracentron sinense]